LIVKDGSVVNEIGYGEGALDTAVCGKYLAVSTDSYLYLYDLSDPENPRELWRVGGVNLVFQVAFSPDCKYIAVADLLNHKLKIFDIKGNLVLEKDFGKEVWSVAWWKDRIAVGLDGGDIYVYKVEGYAPFGGLKPYLWESLSPEQQQAYVKCYEQVKDPTACYLRVVNLSLDKWLGMSEGQQRAFAECYAFLKDPGLCLKASQLPDKEFSAFLKCLSLTNSTKCLEYSQRAYKVIKALSSLPCEGAKPYIMKIFLDSNVECLPSNETLKAVSASLEKACSSIKEVQKQNVNVPSVKEFLKEAEDYFTKCLYKSNMDIEKLLDYCTKQTLVKIRTEVKGNVTSAAERYATYLYSTMKRDYIIYKSVAPWLSQCGVNTQVKVPNLKLLVRTEIAKVCSNLTGSQTPSAIVVYYQGIQAQVPKELSGLAKLKEYLLEPNSMYQRLAKAKGPLADQARKAMLLRSDLIAMMLRANSILDQFLRDFAKLKADNSTLVNLLSKPVVSYDQLYAIYTKFMELKLDYVNLKGDWEQLGKQLSNLLASSPAVDVGKVNATVGNPKEFLEKVINNPPTGWELFRIQRKITPVGGIRGIADAYLKMMIVNSYTTYTKMNSAFERYSKNVEEQLKFYKELVSTISALK